MYKIIGADQKEYGPIPADQIRQWIAEGRLNGQTAGQAEGSPEWRPLSEFPEFADALGAMPMAAMPQVLEMGGSSTSPGNILARGYDIDIGHCIARGWNLVKENFLLVVGTTLLVMIVTVGINQIIALITRPAMQSLIRGNVTPGAIFIVALGYILGMPIYSIFYGGLYGFYLKLIRRQPVNVSDAFVGFSPVFGQLALVGLVVGLLTLLGFALCVLPGIYLAVAWIFGVPLVIDKRMDFWDAMEMSRKIVNQHFWIVLGLLLLVGLISAAGLVACCVGVFVTTPIGYIALIYAYEDVFNPSAAPTA